MRHHQPSLCEGGCEGGVGHFVEMVSMGLVMSEIVIINHSQYSYIHPCDFLLISFQAHKGLSLAAHYPCDPLKI